MIYFGENGTKKQSKKAVCGIDGKKHNVVSAWANKDGKPVCIWNGTTHPKDAFMYLPTSNSAAGAEHPYYSKDGITWTKLDNTIPTSASPHVIYANGYFILPSGGSGSYHYLYRSKDGISWEKCTPTFTSNMNDIAYGKVNGITYYVGVGYPNNIYYAPDLDTAWTINTIAASEIVRISYRNGRFVCVAKTSTYRNASGSISTWESISGRPSTNALTITCDADRFYTVDENGNVYSLSDTDTAWTKLSNLGISLSTDSNHFCYEDMLYANKMLIVADYTGKIFYSSDNGTTWGSTSVEIGKYNYSMVSLTYGNGMFLCCVHGILYYSSDGKAWTKVMANNCYWENVVYRADGGWEH